MGAEGQESMERDLICAKDCVPFESEMMVKGGGGRGRGRERQAIVPPASLL